MEKSRITQHQVQILQRHFNQNPKPRTQEKRMFAEDLGVGLVRINVRTMILRLLERPCLLTDTELVPKSTGEG